MWPESRVISSSKQMSDRRAEPTETVTAAKHD